MAFDIFKKKEVIENSDIEKSNNDIVEDFGTYINNNVENNNGELNISSFESNFAENIGNQEPSISVPEQVDFSNPIIDTNSSYHTYEEKNYHNFDTSIATDTNEDNFDISKSIMSNNFNDKNTQDNNIPNNLPVVEDNFNSNLNINDYDYNPIMDNLENEKNNIKNSQDINAVLSNLHKKNTNNTENQTQQIPQNQSSSFIEKKVEPIPTYFDDVDPGYKKCPNCGQKMREDYKQCFACGTMF